MIQTWKYKKENKIKSIVVDLKEFCKPDLSNLSFVSLELFGLGTWNVLEKCLKFTLKCLMNTD